MDARKGFTHDQLLTALRQNEPQKVMTILEAKPRTFDINEVITSWFTSKQAIHIAFESCPNALGYLLKDSELKVDANTIIGFVHHQDHDFSRIKSAFVGTKLLDMKNKEGHNSLYHAITKCNSQLALDLIDAGASLDVKFAQTHALDLAFDYFPARFDEESKLQDDNFPYLRKEYLKQKQSSFVQQMKQLLNSQSPQPSDQSEVKQTGDTKGGGKDLKAVKELISSAPIVVRHLLWDEAVKLAQELKHPELQTYCQEALLAFQRYHKHFLLRAECQHNFGHPKSFMLINAKSIYALQEHMDKLSDKALYNELIKKCTAILSADILTQVLGQATTSSSVLMAHQVKSLSEENAKLKLKLADLEAKLMEEQPKKINTESEEGNEEFTFDNDFVLFHLPKDKVIPKRVDPGSRVGGPAMIVSYKLASS